MRGKKVEKMFKMIQKIFNRSVGEKEINYETAQKILKKQNGILIDVRSKQAKMQLEQMGYSNVFHIKGGLNNIN